MALKHFTLPQIRRRAVPSVPAWMDMPPLLARILAARGVSSVKELSLGLADLPHPDTFTALVDGVQLLLDARAAHRRICVVGDYDADGATATAVMVRGLSLLGFDHVSFLVPDRFTYGYGLSPAIVELAAEQCAPDLIITVDNGIASIDGVAAANARGIEVLITDHHLPGAQLPAAAGIINPRLPNSGFDAENLAGVGVAFYLLMGLQAALREQNFKPSASVSSLLDLVALGTVADVVVLDGANRILVEQGLRRLRAGKGSPGVSALLRVAGRDPARVVAADMGFAAGPRLNAAGRLADMTLGIQCLLADSAAEADLLAEQLDSINRERRQIEQGMRDAAATEVTRLQAMASVPAGVCINGDDWHEGVVGILASRIKDALYRPVIAFAPAQRAGELKGSGRSIPGVHLRDVLDAVATANPGLLNKFGGHAMAAGLTLERHQLPVFREAFAEAVSAQLSPALMEKCVETDGPLTDADISLHNAEMLNHRFPWGQGFPAPCFDGDFEVLSHRVVGERHLKLTLGLPDTRGVVDGIFFNAPVADLPRQMSRVRGVYRLEVNEFRGQRQPQLLFDYLQPL